MNAPETALEIKGFFTTIAAFGTALFGWVGAKTEYAVKSFQKGKGVTVDGIVGEKTWNKLLKGQ